MQYRTSVPASPGDAVKGSHLPRFNELAPAFKENGVAQVVCMAVNDPFVMEEWAKGQECNSVFVLPDGNGSFTEQMGMLVDKSDLNFGKRSWRYSMLVRDGTIEKMFIEPDEPGDPFTVSDAKKQLKEARVEYAEVKLPHTIRTRVLGAIAKARTVPQLFVNGELIGGSEQIDAWVKRRTVE